MRTERPPSESLKRAYRAAFDFAGSVAGEISIRHHDGDREGRASERVEDVVETPVHGGDHHTSGDWDEQVREPALMPPRDQAHDDRTRHVRAGKRAAARAAARRYLTN